MKFKIIHSFVFLLLISQSVHEVHASVSHDTEACEVCIHVQSNDDGVSGDSPRYGLFDVALHLKNQALNQNLTTTPSNSADFIRGPPTFS